MDEQTNVVETTATESPAVETKTFSQEEVDSVVKTRLAKSEKAFLTKLGLEKKEDLDGFVAKVSEYDKLKTQNDALNSELASLKAEKERAKYVRVIEKANVDDEIIELVYSKVAPEKDETTEAYKERLDKYLANHTNFIKGNVSTINTSINLNAGRPAPTGNQRMNNLIRGKE